MCSSVAHFEDLVGHFKMTANPKQEQPRQQNKPWTIDDQDLERNKAKVSKYRWKPLIHVFFFFLLNMSSPSGIQSLRQIRLNEVLQDYSRDAALIVVWVSPTGTKLSKQWTAAITRLTSQTERNYFVWLLIEPCRWEEEECVPAHCTWHGSTSCPGIWGLRSC